MCNVFKVGQGIILTQRGRAMRVYGWDRSCVVRCPLSGE